MKNTLPFFSANCLTENGVVMASTEAAGDMYHQVTSLPVGIHPEPVTSTAVDFSTLLVVGVTDLAVVLLRLWAL